MTARNPLKLDPTRTKTLRRQFMIDVRRRFRLLRREIMELIVVEDAFGLKDTPGVSPWEDALKILSENGARPTANKRWKFNSDPKKINNFRLWLEKKLDEFLMMDAGEEEGDDVEKLMKAVDDAWFKKYSEAGYRKGAGRAFDDASIARRAATGAGEELAFFKGTREEFLRAAFSRPVAIEKVKILAGRVYTELKGVSSTMSQQLTRELTDGLTRGLSPRRVARNITDSIRKIEKTRALTIARTETIRAHAEGQLDALEIMEMDEVGVMVEWSSAGFNVCPLCEEMDGVVFKVEEARGMIPRHPNCRCAYMPANVGESPKGQKRSKKQIQEAIDKSIAAERPKKSKRTLAEQKTRTSWGGADADVSSRRPKKFEV